MTVSELLHGIPITPEEINAQMEYEYTLTNKEEAYYNCKAAAKEFPLHFDSDGLGLSNDRNLELCSSCMLYGMKVAFSIVQDTIEINMRKYE